MLYQFIHLSNTFEHTDEVEMGASISHSQGHPQLEPPIPVLDTTTAKPNRLSTSGSLGMFCHSHASIESLTLNRGHFQWMFPLRRSGDELLRFLNDPSKSQRSSSTIRSMQLLAKSMKDRRKVRLNATCTNLHPRTW